MAQDMLVIRKILVGTEGLPDDERALTAFCSTLDPQRIRLRVVHVLTVPDTAPLDVAMPESERQTAQLLERSRKIAERFDMPVETAVLRGREVASVLAEEARESASDAVCIRFRARHSPIERFVVSATVGALLASSPCPVITFHFPHH